MTFHMKRIAAAFLLALLVTGCGDGDGENPLPCSDSTCSTGGWECTDVPAGGGGSYCCGDGTCEGAEDINNCAIDCKLRDYFPGN